jgi:prepilin peptidase CpaA
MHPLITGLLLLLLFAAAWNDVRSHRIPNKLVFVGTITAIVFNAIAPLEMGGLGILDSLAGLAVGVVALLPLYLLRIMGAGDVKLMAMTGTFLGAEGTAAAFMCVLLSGGVLALCAALHKAKLVKTPQRLKIALYTMLIYASMPSSPIKKDHAVPETESTGKLPYGVAIAVGTTVYLAIEHWR